MNLLEQLKKYTKVVADTGDIDSIQRYKPIDGTTNPSLIFDASQNPKYASLVSNAIEYAKKQPGDTSSKINFAVDKLAVNFGLEILRIVPGRASTEVDARLSFDCEGSIKKAHQIIALYEAEGYSRERVLIKLASTWEGIKAAEELEKDGIHCNLTLLFTFAQAVACAEARVRLISPFVGRILDWYKKDRGVTDIPAHEDPGVLSVRKIFNYYKKFGYDTQVMAASFRNIGEILELAGCELLTIAPKFLHELESTEGILERKLSEDEALKSDVKKIMIDEKTFRWMMNEDSMATEKLSEGIRNFTKDLIKLEEQISIKL